VGGGGWYGLAALATPLSVAKGVLKQQFFKLVALLGVNCNVKRKWRTLHRAFGRVGMFSFVVEQMIGMINIFTQHYEAGTTLAKKFTASLETLQLDMLHWEPSFGELQQIRIIGDSMLS
jgi:hypothetical protein